MKAYAPPTKQCVKCGQQKEFDAFYNQPGSPDGKAAICTLCAYGPPWNPEPRICLNCGNEYIPVVTRQKYCCPQCQQEYYEKEMRQVGRFRIFERDEFRCAYCGMSSVEDAAELHVDHIIPCASGGENIASNLITSCARCNLEKGHRPMGTANTRRIITEVKRRNLKTGIEPQTTIKL